MTVSVGPFVRSPISQLTSNVSTMAILWAGITSSRVRRHETDAGPVRRTGGTVMVAIPIVDILEVRKGKNTGVFLVLSKFHKFL